MGLPRGIAAFHGGLQRLAALLRPLFLRLRHWHRYRPERRYMRGRASGA